MFPQTWSTKAQINIAALVEIDDDVYEDFRPSAWKLCLCGMWLWWKWRLFNHPLCLGGKCWWWRFFIHSLKMSHLGRRWWWWWFLEIMGSFWNFFLFCLCLHIHPLGKFLLGEKWNFLLFFLFNIRYLAMAKDMVRIHSYIFACPGVGNKVSYLSVTVFFH